MKNTEDDYAYAAGVAAGWEWYQAHSYDQPANPYTDLTLQKEWDKGFDDGSHDAEFDDYVHEPLFPPRI